MSLSEIIMGVNSQAVNVPLNHLMWLAYYKTYGENSYVFQNKDILHELYKSPVAANDLKICNEAFEYIGNNCENIIGPWLANVYSLKNISGLRDCTSIGDVIANQNTFDAVVASVFKDVFFALNKTVEVFATTAGLKVASGNNEIMTILEKSNYFIEKVSENPDIVVLTKSAAYGSTDISIDNAFLIANQIGIAYNSSNASSKLVSQSRTILHGNTDPISGTIKNKFVKTSTLRACTNSNFRGNEISNEFKYIQLDNVV